MGVSLNYQNGGNLNRAPYYNGNLNIGPRIIGNLDQSLYIYIYIYIQEYIGVYGVERVGGIEYMETTL